MKFTLLALFALLTFVQETPWTPFVDPDNRRQPERKSVMDVLHYKITLKIDDQDPNHLVEGWLDIDLVLTEETDTLVLDAADLKVDKIRCPKGTRAPKQGDGKLIVGLGRKAAKGEKLDFGFGYVGRPQRGLFFTGPDAAYPKKPWMVWSQGATEYNHFWFPCYDSPNDRATSEVILTVREKYQTVSNGALVKSETKDGWRTDHWKMDIPHVAYLTSIAVGEFDVVQETFDRGTEKIPVQYFVPRGWHSEEEIRHTFERTPAMMKFFSDRTGVPYPYAKYAQVVAEDFIWGGMENISATTLHPGTVVKKRSWADRDSDSLIAHELAHQWFGDLVTCRTWTHIWLNEGFATYMEALWQESVGGREALVADLEDGLGWYLGESRKETVRPIACEHYTHPDDVFDSHVYPKAACVLHMLRGTLGDEAWWKGLNLYLTKHRAGVVSTDDFRAAMEQASGQDLKKFFDQWIWKAGHPEFKVAASWDAAAKKLTLKVDQVQDARPLAWQDLKTEVPIFSVPIDVEFETKAGRKLHRIDVKDRSHTFIFDLDSEPEIIDFDRDGAILKALKFERTADQLIQQLAKDDQPWHRWWAAGELSGKPEGVAALGAALKSDLSKHVRIAAARSLGAIETPEAGAALLDGTQSDARVRRAVLEALGGHAKGAAKALDKAFQEDPSPACRAAAAASLGKAGEPFELFGFVAKNIDDEVLIPGILAGMLAHGDSAVVAACVTCTAPGVHPVIRRRATEVLADSIAVKRDPEGIKKFCALIGDSNFRVRQAAIQKSGDIRDDEITGALERQVKVERDHRLIKEIRTSLKKPLSAK